MLKELQKEAKKKGVDKSDFIILATALASKADALVTGHKDFHNPEINKLIKIIETDQAF